MPNTEAASREIGNAVIADKRFVEASGFIRNWQAGKLTRESAATLCAGKYYKHVEGGFGAACRCGWRRGRMKSLETGLVMENCGGRRNPARPHPKLWRNFCGGAGVSEEGSDVEASPCPDETRGGEIFGRFAGGRSVARPWRRLYAYEAQVPEIGRRRIDGLKKFYGITEPAGLAYFEVA